MNVFHRKVDLRAGYYGPCGTQGSEGGGRMLKVGIIEEKGRSKPTGTEPYKYTYAGLKKAARAYNW